MLAWWHGEKRGVTPQSRSLGIRWVIPSLCTEFSWSRAWLRNQHANELEISVKTSGFHISAGCHLLTRVPRPEVADSPLALDLPMLAAQTLETPPWGLRTQQSRDSGKGKRGRKPQIAWGASCGATNTAYVGHSLWYLGITWVHPTQWQWECSAGIQRAVRGCFGNQSNKSQIVFYMTVGRKRFLGENGSFPLLLFSSWVRWLYHVDFVKIQRKVVKK